MEYEGYEFKVVSIGEGAFSGNKKLLTADLWSVETVGEKAFYQSTKLESAGMEKVKKVGIMALASCSSLSGIGFGDDPATACACSFYGCRSIASPDLPAKVKAIGNHLSTAAPPRGTSISAPP